jgi:hypothetical protein
MTWGSGEGLAGDYTNFGATAWGCRAGRMHWKITLLTYTNTSPRPKCGYCSADSILLVTLGNHAKHTMARGTPDIVFIIRQEKTATWTIRKYFHCL